MSATEENSNKIQDTLQKARIDALNALRNKPSKYFIEVIDNTSLPEKLKNKKEIAFVINPPTFDTLTEIALITESLPEELFTNEAMNKKALEHIGEIIKIIAVLAHGNTRKKMPDWYLPFLSSNLNLQETLQLWFECAQKIQTDFFLPFFQIARAMNPMTMRTKSSIPSN